VYKTIVVPLDSSERAERILPHVEELAGIKLGKIVLVHVIEPTAFSPATATAPGGTPIPAPQTYMDQLETMEAMAEEYLSKIQTILKTKDIEAETVIETGAVAERIVHVAEKRSADLIALTSHGRTGLARVFFGSVALGVLHRAETPLLLVRSRDDE